MDNAHDASWVNVALLGDLLHQVPYCTIIEIDGTVVVGLLINAGEADVKACNWGAVSSVYEEVQPGEGKTYSAWVDAPPVDDKSDQYQRLQCIPLRYKKLEG